MKRHYLKCLVFALIVSIISSCIVSMPAIVSAAENITVQLDGRKLEFDVPPQIINGRTMVPMRKIFEEMGTVVEWDNATQTAVATNDLCVINATINNNIMKINGTPKTLDVSPQLVGGRTLVPARFVAEALGADVDWDGETSTVIIKSMTKNDTVTSDDAFVDGFEKAVFSKFNSNASENGLGGTNVYLNCVIDRIDFLDTDVGKAIIGYLTDDGQNNWLTLMHTTPLVDKDEYKSIVGKPITLLGVYEGFSSVEKLPVVNLYKLRVDETGEIKDGIETVLENEEDSSISNPKSTMTVYTVDGKTKEISASDVEIYQKLCWYTTPVQVLYSADGKTTVVNNAEIEKYKSSGWYVEPVVTMYAADGRTTVVAQSEVEAHKNVGWYSVPVVTMYAADGRTTVVAQTEVEAYEKVGWYTSKEEITLVSNRNKLSSLIYNKSRCGSMTGTITYQYNKYIGTRADVGAGVLLIQTNHIPTDMDNLNIGHMSVLLDDPTLYYTEVDGMGNYYLDNVPAGEYFLLIKSEETNQSPEISKIHGEMAENYLKGKISSKALDTLKGWMEVKSFVIEKIEIKANQTYRYSKDWGYTYY